MIGINWIKEFKILVKIKMKNNFIVRTTTIKQCFKSKKRMKMVFQSEGKEKFQLRKRNKRKLLISDTLRKKFILNQS
jgi:hypothetical protein